MRKKVSPKKNPTLRSEKAHAPKREQNHPKEITRAVKKRMNKRPSGGFFGPLRWYPEKWLLD